MRYNFLRLPHPPEIRQRRVILQSVEHHTEYPAFPEGKTRAGGQPRKAALPLRVILPVPVRPEIRSMTL